MAIMIEEEKEKEKEKEDNLKQTSSFPPTARETAVHQTKTSHNEKNVTSLPECMHVCIPPLQLPSLPNPMPQSTRGTTSPILHTPYLHHK